MVAASYKDMSVQGKVQNDPLHQRTIAGIINQSSHQNDWRVNRRAVNRRAIASAAIVNVAMLTPSMRGTWVSDRSTLGGGGGRVMTDVEPKTL